MISPSRSNGNIPNPVDEEHRLFDGWSRPQELEVLALMDPKLTTDLWDFILQVLCLDVRIFVQFFSQHAPVRYYLALATLGEGRVDSASGPGTTDFDSIHWMARM